MKKVTTLNRHTANIFLKYSAAIAAFLLFLFYAFRPRITIIENITSYGSENSESHKVEETSDLKFNLIRNTWRIFSLQDMFNSEECSLEYINDNKLQQDHPCVIEILKRDYLIPPPSEEVPLNLDSNSLNDRSPGQTNVILRLLKNQTNGFYVDCGALDGEFMSNTIDLERKYGWTGVLIEANPITFEKLRKKNRKSWLAPVCLSLYPYPTKVKFQPKAGDPGHSHIEDSVKTLQKPGKPGVDPDMVEVQCFPLYSILLAIGAKHVDFFSLDVEGHEIAVLKTIPFHKIFMKTLTVEWDNIPEGEPALTSFMENNGYIKFSKVDFQWSHDVIFIKDAINTPN